jgi:polyphosphate kinase 2 (PPK2 family)
MLARTNTPAAPWTVVESSDKWYARLKTLQTVISYGEQIL